MACFVIYLLCFKYNLLYLFELLTTTVIDLERVGRTKEDKIKGYAQNQLGKGMVQKVGAAVPKIKFTTRGVEENC